MSRKYSEVSNPLDGGAHVHERKIDNLVGTVPIKIFELEALVNRLKSLEVNDTRLRLLDEEKLPYLFNSAQLSEILQITPSVKTRLAVIVMLGPRLTDPRAKVDYFLELFRFSEEKEKVQEVLKARTQFLSSNLYRQHNLILGSSSADAYSPANGIASSSSENKPFAGIKGLAQARERGPAKLASKPRLPPVEVCAPPSEGPPSGTLKTVPLSRYSSEPVLVASGDIVSALKKSYSTAAPKPLETDLPPAWMKDSGLETPRSSAQIVFPSPASSSSQGTVNLSSPSKGSTSLYEFGSIGKVQRMIKSFSKFIPGYSPTREGEDPSDRFLARGSSSYHSMTGATEGEGVASGQDTPRVGSPSDSPAKQRRTTDISSIQFDSPRKISRNLSAATVMEEEDMRTSECTSVEDSDVQDSDSVQSWRRTRSKRGVRSLAGDIDRRKGISECHSPDHSDNSTNESAHTERDSTSTAGRRPHSVKRRSSSLLVTSPIREAERNSLRRNSETSQAIVDQFKFAVNSNIKGSFTFSSASVMAKDLILYQNMPVEGPVDRDGDGTPLFRYYELVRMNFVKQYDGIKQSDLILAMVDSDFEEHLGISKDEFKAQPAWRQVQRKKSLLLF